MIYRCLILEDIAPEQAEAYAEEILKATRSQVWVSTLELAAESASILAHAITKRLPDVKIVVFGTCGGHAPWLLIAGAERVAISCGLIQAESGEWLNAMQAKILGLIDDINWTADIDGLDSADPEELQLLAKEAILNYSQKLDHE